MAHLRWHHDPARHGALHRPVLLAAFEGWNDAGESATTAVRYLARSLDAERVASIDAEEFYDFTVARPQVRLDEGLTRQIEWPDPAIDVATLPNGRHLVLLTGIEPALRWRTFTSEVVSMATTLGVETVMTLGALLADVPHTRPVRVTGTATDPALVAELGFTRSRYEGPTGILSILLAGCASTGIRAASLWATTPHYLRETPSPKAALALVERVGRMLDFSVDVTELEIATAAYERQVDDMLAGEDDVADYVRRLEEDGIEGEDGAGWSGSDGAGWSGSDGAGWSGSDGADDFEIPSQEELASEVERFLRDQRGGS